jgi:single-strand DNA-binding protein
MSGVNKVILLGFLGADPECRTLDSGKMVANFSLATTETYKKDGEKQSVTEWHRVCLFGAPAEIAQKYLKKGQLVYIEGKLKTRSWEKDGVTKYTTEIIGDRLQMIGGAPSNNSSNNEEPALSSAEDNGGLPF